MWVIFVLYESHCRVGVVLNKVESTINWKKSAQQTRFYHNLIELNSNQRRQIPPGQVELGPALRGEQVVCGCQGWVIIETVVLFVLQSFKPVINKKDVLMSGPQQPLSPGWHLSCLNYTWMLEQTSWLEKRWTYFICCCGSLCYPWDYSTFRTDTW